MFCKTWLRLVHLPSAIKGGNMEKGQGISECVLILIRAIVLQTYSTTEYISSFTCRVESPTSLFYRFLVLQIVGLTQQ